MNYIRPSMFLAFVMHFCVLFLTVTMMVSHTETECVYGMAIIFFSTIVIEVSKVRILHSPKI